LSSLADRLRSVVRPARPAEPQADDSRGFEDPGDADVATATSGRAGVDLRDPAVVLDGTWHDDGGHRFVVVERRYLPGHRHGDVTVADGLPPSGEGWPALDLLARTSCRSGLLFVDLETTGLAGGAGTYAFLVGCGWFDGGAFRIRQYLMANPAVERSMLGSIAKLAAAAGTVVTYNGKTFDLPLIETRYLFHRLDTPFAGLPHVDMLHPARRLWRGDADDAGLGTGIDAASPGCRLSTLERRLCGFEREGDVPGFEIPERYFRYVRTGDARPLAGVLEHNRLDLLSLALVTARAAQLVEEGAVAARTAREALGLGGLYQFGGRLDEARRCYALASGLDEGASPMSVPRGDEGTQLRAEALRAFARLSRRARCFDDAAEAWTRVLALRGCPAPLVREATEALAVHHEHRRRDLRRARSFALQSLQLPLSASRRDALHHRVARLERKLAAPPVPTSAFLF
jgi:uncharacterized protein YprB with RNaseH-like and TPR domain